MYSLVVMTVVLTSPSVRSAALPAVTPPPQLPWHNNEPIPLEPLPGERWLSDYQFNLDCIVQVQHLICCQESTGVAAASWLGSGAARRRILAARGMETAMSICESDDTLANSNSLHSNPLGRGLAWSSLDLTPGAGASWCAAPTTVRSSDGSSMRRTTAVRGQTRKT